MGGKKLPIMRKHMVNAIVFLASITTLGCYNLIADGKPKVSEVENRELAKAPAFSVGAFASGAFFREVDTFFSDNFVFRESLVLASSYIKECWRVPTLGGGQSVRIIYSVGGDDDDYGGFDGHDAWQGAYDELEARLAALEDGTGGGYEGGAIWGDVLEAMRRGGAYAAGQGDGETVLVAAGEAAGLATAGHVASGSDGGASDISDGGASDSNSGGASARNGGGASDSNGGGASDGGWVRGQGAQSADRGQSPAQSEQGAAIPSDSAPTAAAQADAQQAAATGAVAAPGAAGGDAAATGEAAGAGPSAGAPTNGYGDSNGDGNGGGGDDGYDELDDGSARKVGGLVIHGDRIMEIYGFYAPSCDIYADIVNQYAQALNPELTGIAPQDEGRRPVRVVSLLAPTSIAFNLDEEYRKLSSPQDRTVRYINERLRDDIVKVPAYEVMELHKGEYMHFRTDHHWTALGAYYAYRAFAEATGVVPVRRGDCESGEVPGFLGSLYGKNPSAAIKKNPDLVQWYEAPHETAVEVFTASGGAARAGKLINLAHADTANKYQIFLGGDAPYIRITTDVKNGKKIVVVKESYGLAFVPWLVPHYEQIHVVDPRHYKDGIVSLAQAEAVDDVLFVNGMHMSGARSYATALIENLR